MLSADRRGYEGLGGGSAQWSVCGLLSHEYVEKVQDHRLLQLINSDLQRLSVAGRFTGVLLVGWSGVTGVFREGDESGK